jgi:hypothetical protein
MIFLLVVVLAVLSAIAQGVRVVPQGYQWTAERPSLPEGAPIVVISLRGTAVRVEGRRRD